MIQSYFKLENEDYNKDMRVIMITKDLKILLHTSMLATKFNKINN